MVDLGVLTPHGVNGVFRCQSGRKVGFCGAVTVRVGSFVGKEGRDFVLEDRGEEGRVAVVAEVGVQCSGVVLASFSEYVVASTAHRGVIRLLQTAPETA